MAEDLINSIVDRPVVKKQIQDTTADLVVLQKQLVDTANSVVTLNAALGKSTNSKDLSGNITKVNTELEKTVKIREKIRTTIISNSQAEVDAYNKSVQGEKNITSTVNARNKAEAQAANEATARNAKIIKQQEKQATEYIRAQGLIEAARTRLERYKILAEGATNPAQLQKYNQKIQATEIAIKQLSNAGKDGFDGLGNAVKKSSNIFQSIGQKVVTLGRLLPGIGTIGLIAFATDPIIEYISALDLFGGKVSNASKLLKELNDVNKTASKDFGDQSTKLKILYETATDVNNSYAIRLSATRELQQAFPETFENLSKEEIMNGKVGKSVKELTEDLLQQAVARASVAKIQELAGKQQEAEFQKERIRIGNINANVASSSLKNKTGIGAALNAPALRENNQKAAEELKVQDNLIRTYQQQIDFFSKNIKAKNVESIFGGGDGGKADEAARKKAADEAKKRLQDAIKLAQQQARELLDLQNDYEKQLADAKKAGDKADEERLKGILKNSEAVFEQANSQRLLQIEKNQSEALALVADQYAKGILSKEEYEKEKLEIEFESNKESIESANLLSAQLIKLQKEFNADTGTEEEKLARLQIKLSELVTGKKLSDAEKVAARQKELNGKIKELAEEAAQFVITLVNAGFENRKNKLQDEANAIDNNTQEQIKQVERSVGSEQVKADKIAVINAKAQADKARIAQQQKQIDIEKAKFDKAVAIARIIENTAVAVTAALTSLPPNVPLAFVVGAIGAIQLATAIAQPIPTYKDGTDNHKGGWAIFGEAGMEYVKEPGKAGYLTNGATLAPLPAGTQVISNADLMSAMANPSGGGYVSNQLDLSAMIQETRSSTKQLVKALETKQQSNYLRGRRDEKKFNEYLKRNIN